MALDMTFNELQNNMRISLNALSEVLADDNIGSANRTILEAVAAQMEEILYYFDQQIAKLFLDTAEGEDLDLLAYDRYRLTRKPAKAAIARVRVIKNTVGLDDRVGERIPIPIGTLFSTDPDPQSGVSVTYETTEAASILITGLGDDVATDFSGQEYFVPVRCTEVGEVGNSGVGKIKVVSSSVEVDAVVNLEPATGGKDAQTDAEFRADVVEFLLTLARGTVRALRFAALKGNYVSSVSVVETGPISGKEYFFLDAFTGEIHSMVYQAGQLWSGKVCVYVDDRGNIPNYDTLVKVIYDLEEYRGAGTTVLLAAPDVKFLDVALQVFLEEDADAEQTRDAITDAVTSYISGLGLGEKMHRNRLIAAILSIPSVRNVEVLAPSSDETDVGVGQVVRLRDLQIRQVREVN